MKTILKVIMIFAVFTLAASCSKLDVVGGDSVRAFNDLLQKIPQDQALDENGCWSLAAPDGKARFFWNGEQAGLVFDAQPFIDAGLNIQALPMNVKNGSIIIDCVFQNSGRLAAAPLEDYQNIVKTSRGAIGYHAEMDHYGVSLGNGNMFEWAKDINANDKDIVFVLDPALFIAAGVDPARVSGWTFATVTVDDANGKPAQVEKILKPFNL